MRIVQICQLATIVCMLAASASWRDCRADADSISEQWVTPSISAEKKNPIAPTEASILAGQKIYLKHCATCHGKNGHGDGPGVVDLRIQPRTLFEPLHRADRSGA